MNIDIDMSFLHRFACEVSPGLPGDHAVQHYFPADRIAGQDGVVVRVRPAFGDAWVGMFAFGNIERGSASHVLSMPDPERLCVVASGAGYIVTAAEPREWEAVESTPIIDVRAVPSAALIVFANYTDMVAYGRHGVTWRTKRLAWDRLRIVTVVGNTLIGETWDIREEAMRRFEVDLTTGAARGGIDF